MSEGTTNLASGAADLAVPGCRVTDHLEQDLAMAEHRPDVEQYTRASPIGPWQPTNAPDGDHAFDWDSIFEHGIVPAMGDTHDGIAVRRRLGQVCRLTKTPGPHIVGTDDFRHRLSSHTPAVSAGQRHAGNRSECGRARYANGVLVESLRRTIRVKWSCAWLASRISAMNAAIPYEHPEWCFTILVVQVHGLGSV